MKEATSWKPEKINSAAETAAYIPHQVLLCLACSVNTPPAFQLTMLPHHSTTCIRHTSGGPPAANAPRRTCRSLVIQTA
ncbi:hypothetical protein IG631_01031 [Alternaria alternata]|nr:hypothetical protein IG631_01031 [Alternaria alternata]